MSGKSASLGGGAKIHGKSLKFYVYVGELVYLNPKHTNYLWESVNKNTLYIK